MTRHAIFRKSFIYLLSVVAGALFLKKYSIHQNTTVATPPETKSVSVMTRERKEERYWFWSKVGAAAGGLAGIVGAFTGLIALFFAIGAYQQAQRQADAAEDANRPWLAIEKLDVPRVFITKDELLLGAKVIFRNIGHSPALDVNVAVNSIDFAPSVPSGSQACLSAKQPKEILSDIVAFPSDQNQELRTIFKNRMVFLRSGNLGDRPMIAVSGCLTYIDARGISKHGTSFKYYITEKRLPGQTIGNDIDLSKEGFIDSDKIEAIKYFSESYAY